MVTDRSITPGKRRVVKHQLHSYWSSRPPMSDICNENEAPNCPGTAVFPRHRLSVWGSERLRQKHGRSKSLVHLGFVSFNRKLNNTVFFPRKRIKTSYSHSITVQCQPKDTFFEKGLCTPTVMAVNSSRA